MPADGIVLSGTLHLRPGTTGAPAVVAVHGAGSGSREDELFAHLIDTLPPLVIAVFTWDRRGTGASADGDDPLPHYSTLVGDTVAAMRAVAKDPVTALIEPFDGDGAAWREYAQPGNHAVEHYNSAPIPDGDLNPGENDVQASLSTTTSASGASSRSHRWTDSFDRRARHRRLKVRVFSWFTAAMTVT